MSLQTRVGIIGGTGLYDLENIQDRRSLSVDTPFGSPSSPIVMGTLDGVELCFIARHGIGHRYLPSEVPYRANIYALKQMGVEWCIGVSAVGSLSEEFAPGDIVIPHQVIDRTKERAHTFFGRGIVGHVSFADPFCPVLRKALIESAKAAQKEVLAKQTRVKNVHEEGVYVCMEGPAFSTRAESQWHRSWGASLIGMTALPEAKLAREAELSYATLALVTDYDCWRTETADVDLQDILRIMASNVDFARQIISAVIPQLRELEQPDHIRRALSGAIMTDRRLWPTETVEELQPILERLVEAEDRPVDGLASKKERGAIA